MYSSKASDCKKLLLNFTGWHPLVKGVSYSLGNMAPSRKFSSTVTDLLEITIEKLIVSVCRYYSLFITQLE